jgi:hypothetical protein
VIDNSKQDFARMQGNYIIYDRDGKILEDVGRLGMALYFGKFYPC